ncbi:MAG TPA: ElyC/SanA/YdcF family protein [Bryobacteraceae bacterium]|nr:ElyC/SanA/YdcF family protein [Bryobacteraceae bacterium]
MRKFRWFLSISFLLLCVAAVFAFRDLGQWLMLDEPLRASKAIVIMGGGIPFRAMEAAELYKSKWAGEVWITQGKVDSADLAMARIGITQGSEDNTNQLILEKLGVPPGAIHLIPERVQNTVAEEKAVVRYSGSSLQAPLILVTSKYHARRLRVIWDKAIGKGVPLIVRYASEEPYDASRWWSNSGDALSTFKELFGILNAQAGFPIEPRDR